MVLKKKKPLTNSSRNTVLIDYKKTLVPSKKKTPKALLEINKKRTGRSTHTGRVTMRHQKGQQKRYYRFIDFKRYPNDNIVGRVESIEYDPNRNCFISLICYQNGKKTFILSPEGIKVGDEIISGANESVPLSLGNNLPLNFIPANTIIHNLEIRPEKGAQFLRSAGSFGEVIGKEENGKYVKIKLRSKEIRRVLGVCRATIGKVGNSEANLVRLGKAGRNRWRGVSPAVRGSAMNPCDHPHGGGEGKSGIGRSSPRDPWGNKTLGKKTRRKKKDTNKYIVQPRSFAKKK